MAVDEPFEFRLNLLAGAALLVAGLMVFVFAMKAVLKFKGR